MYCILYVSAAARPWTREELRDLLEGSRRRNALRGITGMLLYKDGNFLHCIEGEQAVVEALFDKVKQDSRHHGVIVLLREEHDERQFPDYSMGFYDLKEDEVHALPGYNEFLNTPLTGEEFIGKPGRARKLIELFKKNLR